MPYLFNHLSQPVACPSISISCVVLLYACPLLPVCVVALLVGYFFLFLLVRVPPIVQSRPAVVQGSQDSKAASTGEQQRPKIGDPDHRQLSKCLPASMANCTHD